MQQLAWQFALDEVILVGCYPKPDWSSFAQVAETFCEQAEVRKIEINIGADRAQIQFRSELGVYEDLCDALWIESFQSQTSQQKQLESLYEHVLKKLGKKC
jgi:hypothetical protein